MIRLSLLIMLLFSMHRLEAQTPALMEWSKISDGDFALKKVSYDTSASAVILFNKASFSVDVEDGLTTVWHRRIKILKNDGKSWGSFKYTFYSKGNSRHINSIRAHTINQLENGKVEEVAVPSSEIFWVKMDDEHTQIAFAFPAVRVGSIIELEMVVNKKGLSFPDPWYFQSSIPTLYSEIRKLPSPSFQYKFLQKGSRLRMKYPKKKDLVWALDSLPALKSDEFSPNLNDNSESLSFQLSTSSYHMVEMNSWKDFTKIMLADDQYEEYLKVNDMVKTYSSSLVGSAADTLEVIKKLFNDVSTRYSWNHRYRLFPSQSRKEFLSKMSGSSAEKNLFLIALLRSVGLDADPVILSTKDNGQVYKDSPIMEQYNHVIAVITYQGKPLLLDATSQGRAYNLVDLLTLGCDGYRLSKNRGGWILVESPETSSVNVVNEMEYKGNMLKGTMKLAYSGYKAVQEGRAITP